jgi:hypothetical protein
MMPMIQNSSLSLENLKSELTTTLQSNTKLYYTIIYQTEHDVTVSLHNYSKSPLKNQMSFESSHFFFFFFEDALLKDWNQMSFESI